MQTTARINAFLLENRLRIRDNPAVSPDLCLDADSLARAVRGQSEVLRGLAAEAAAGRRTAVVPAGPVDLFPASLLRLHGCSAVVVEERETGDAGLFVTGGTLPLQGAREVGTGLVLVPLLWSNLAPLKNLLQEEDPESTVFPVAKGALQRSSLGIGARFTTLHWPAVAWVMKELRLPLTANQNSIPRELVYDVDAMLDGRLAEVPFPFIGGSVPEGHQGQSVQGMTHAAVASFLKCGFHHHGIPWGFNADHQPIGGRFDAIEDELAKGCAFASYITFDLSPELGASRPIEGEEELSRAFAALGEEALFARVVARVRGLGLSADETAVRRLFTFVLPAMRKLKRRDEAYARVRSLLFTTEVGRRYFRELSIDELPGETSKETLAVCLALAESMGMAIHFVAPNIGFQKNFPYPDNAALAGRIESLYAVASAFGCSLGFHSGSGKSAANYRVAGKLTGGNLEIKTSGRYTYEMGAALAASTEPGDETLWREWYHFTRELAEEGAFSPDLVRRRLAGEFIVHALKKEGRDPAGILASPSALRQALAGLGPSPDHMFWFEYNFLFVLAAEGERARLGDHGPDGYRQRARFYAVSDEARLRYAKNVASYILFLAETTGLAEARAVAAARARLERLATHDAFAQDLVEGGR